MNGHMHGGILEASRILAIVVVGAGLWHLAAAKLATMQSPTASNVGGAMAAIL